MILVDTSGILAAVDPRQAHHAAAARTLLHPQRRILSPFVLAELDYLVSTHAGQTEELKLLDDLRRGAYELAPFDAADVAAAAGIIRQYADLQLGIADASIIVLADRYSCQSVLTLDQRHFRAVTSTRGLPFRLLPADDTD
ncbi:MAG: PIN domain-containing protein [Chloroflexi bacterium]|nr:PIN domain-containing protein [Chloroflexota bacterium]